MLKNKGIEILKAEASWCGGCKAIAPIIRKLKDEYVNYSFLDFDVESNQDYAVKELKVKNLPTLIVFRDGEEISRLTGKKTREEYNELLRQIS